MANGYGDFEEQRIKHMDLIQGVISRLSSNSFLIKGWALTLTGVFLGFAVNSADWKLAAVSALPTVTFWGLDTYFLRSERLFRGLYERVRSLDDEVPPFFMAATREDFVRRLSTGPDKGLANSWWLTLWRPTLLFYYGVILVVAILISVILATTGQPQTMQLPVSSP